MGEGEIKVELTFLQPVVEFRRIIWRLFSLIVGQDTAARTCAVVSSWLELSMVTPLLSFEGKVEGRIARRRRGGSEG